MRWRFVTIAVLVGALGGCRDEAPEPAANGNEGAAAEARAAPNGSAAAKSGSGSAARAEEAISDDAPQPSNEEWERAASVELAGAKELGCDAKLRGPWLRVLCARPNAAGGKPEGVRVVRDEETRVAEASFGVDGVLFVARFVQGTAVAAEVSWSDAKKALLTLAWPSGTERPEQPGSLVSPPPPGSLDPPEGEGSCGKGRPPPGAEAHGCGAPKEAAGCGAPGAGCGAPGEGTGCGAPGGGCEEHAGHLAEHPAHAEGHPPAGACGAPPPGPPPAAN